MAGTPTKSKGKKEQRNEHTGLSGELSAAIMLRRFDPEFINTILCIRDYILLGTTIQLDYVVKMYCDSDNVLCIDTKFNLVIYLFIDIILSPYSQK